MLQADNIAHCINAVRGIDDIVEKVDEVDLDSCHTIILLNCGASEDLMGKFYGCAFPSFSMTSRGASIF